MMENSNKTVVILQKGLKIPEMPSKAVGLLIKADNAMGIRTKITTTKQQTMVDNALCINLKIKRQWLG